MLYCKVRQGNFITKCGRLLLQSASGITKCEKFKNKEPQQKKPRTHSLKILNFSIRKPVDSFKQDSIWSLNPTLIVKI